MSDAHETGRHEPELPESETTRIIALEQAHSKFTSTLRDWLHGNATFEEKEEARVEILRKFCQTIKDQRGGLLPNTLVAIDESAKSVTITLPVVSPARRNFVRDIREEVDALEQIDPNVRDLLG